ncbi:alpha/beta hydrolase [Nocardia sp. NBC_01503]|uniref:alpha/beta fold hydrolase n=1 Tax=Nocardia sp. NBC_01503 TaxID=2975997 RepID=UPI002E7B6B33|nr:alpha/beta hydrolase [Nocardia sp. NBC_01503]WTL31675.1 alpha/beta hydrolase [Nocardia sp. NBC_01503]
MATADAEFEQSTDTVRSADGTTIAYLTVGAGPAVIVVPGALSVARGYARFAAALSGRGFTLHTIERRGRGESGPQGPEYRITEDCADIRAVRDKTGAGLIVGHSYGGLVALEAARDNPDIRKLALYEPGVSIAGSVPSEWMPAYAKYLEQGKPFDAFVEFVRAMGPENVRRIPRWMFRRMMPMFMKAPERDLVVGQLAENLREHREVVRLNDTYPNYAAVTAEVLLMDGDKDRRPHTDADHDQLAKTLPHCERRTLTGLDHFGIDKQAPELVARFIGEFFSRS